jgi:hypothetical protein
MSTTVTNPEEYDLVVLGSGEGTSLPLPIPCAGRSSTIVLSPAPSSRDREWHDDSGHWFRYHGNENLEFNAGGLMQRRYASINDLPIRESDHKFFWPLGRRPDDHPDFLT